MSNSMDEIWEKIHSTGKWGAYPSEHVIRFIARNYYNTDRSKVRILDFGCGQGAHTWYLAREGFDTYAFDGSSSAVKKAKEKLKAEGLKAHFEVIEGTDIVNNYNESFFDAIIDNACIYANRIDDIIVMYQNVFKTLKKNGKLLTVCFGEELDGYQTGEEIEPGTYKNIKDGVLAERGVSHIFSEEELTNILEKTGFHIFRCDWIKYVDNGCLVHQYICEAGKM